MGTWDFDPVVDQIYACFGCRKAFNGSPSKCPNCGGIIHAMGTVFKAPKRRDEKQWIAVEMLWQGGVRYEHKEIANSDWLLALDYDPEQWISYHVRRMMLDTPEIIRCGNSGYINLQDLVQYIRGMYQIISNGGGIRSEHT
ncbi:MAG TPA: hypothetical protein VHL11_20415 [Phototrophicaceae bacterium]|jgi:hypothetical protein|nr:hypothetical protein [Phototrophicaceae bacterium]